MEGIPAGTRIDLVRLQAFMDRRRPGQNRFSTPRSESDMPVFVAGVLPENSADGHGREKASDDPDTEKAAEGSGCEKAAEGPGREKAAENSGGSGSGSGDGTAAPQAVFACGAPVTAVIRNTNTRSKDYAALRCVPRPGHADLTAMVKYGDYRDYAGGGQFSGRLTAPLCIAGGIAIQILEALGIRISARPVMIGNETEEAAMLRAIDRARAEGDSVGGIVECVIEGVPAGVGEPMFDGIENRIAQMVFGIPAVKGVEFGAGFAAAGMRGSENNDGFYYSGSGSVPTAGSSFEEKPARSGASGAPVSLSGQQISAVLSSEKQETETAAAHSDVLAGIRTESNHHGGALGGISSGMPIVFRAAFKPTPSIALAQNSVDTRTGEAVRLSIRGRHDPCIVLRAVPVVEAAAAAAVYDLLLQRESMSGPVHAIK